MNKYNQTGNYGTISVKLVLVGESGVGKSSIISRYINDTFGTMYPEMGIFLTKIVSISPDLPKIRYEIWDTAGQEKYRSITKLYYKDADLILIVFDVSRPCSYNAINNYWLKEVKNNSKSDAMISIVGNKTDLISKVDEEMIRNHVENKGYVYTKTSAKTSEGISALFDVISDKIIKKDLAKEKELKETARKMSKTKTKCNEVTYALEEEKIEIKPLLLKEIKEQNNNKFVITVLKNSELNKADEFEEKEEIKTPEKTKEKVKDKTMDKKVKSKDKEIETISGTKTKVIVTEFEIKDEEQQILTSQSHLNEIRYRPLIKNKVEIEGEQKDNIISRTNSLEKQKESDCNNSLISNESKTKYERTKSVYSIIKKTETKDEDNKSKCC